MKLPELKRKLRKIIELTAYIAKDGSVWGHDTDIGKIDDLIDDAIEILEVKK
ncbi:MAG: hypothetical protein GY861_11855 [bacterium]|nr:hypothetical protein [bacterium]